SVVGDSAADGARPVAGRCRPRRRSRSSPLRGPLHGPNRDITEARARRVLERGRRMLHFTIDGFQGFRSRFDHVPLIQEVLEEVPTQLGLKPVMPAFVLPYYNGVVPEDCGVSAFVFLAGGHFTLHTFSFREAYFADLVAPTAFDAGRLRSVLEAVFPCAITTVQTVNRQDLKDTEPDLDADFGPHLFLNVDAYHGPQSLDTLFALFDRLPRSIGMTPIM